MNTLAEVYAEIDAQDDPLAFVINKIKKASRPSKAKAINAKCRECIYDPVSGAGTWRQQVEACTCTACPLYAVRPISSGEKAGLQKEREE